MNGIKCSVCTACEHPMKYWLGKCAKCGGKNYRVVSANNQFELDRKLQESKAEKMKEAASPLQANLIVAAILAMFCAGGWLYFHAAEVLTPHGNSARMPPTTNEPRLASQSAQQTQH
jgi:hypothetical protein